VGRFRGGGGAARGFLIAESHPRDVNFSSSTTRLESLNKTGLCIFYQYSFGHDLKKIAGTSDWTGLEEYRPTSHASKSNDGEGKSLSHQGSELFG
jgi:hypothetical protein